MSGKKMEQIEVVDVEERQTASVSIDDVLDEMQQRAGEALVAPASGRSLVGSVVEMDIAGSPTRALVRFDEDGDELWVGVLRGLAINEGDSVILSKPENYPRWLITGAFDADESEDQELTFDKAEALEVQVDGRRVEIEGADEIVLKCGEASITLRRNGRVVIRGTYVETRSKGTNRIKGGSVQIN